MVKHYNINMTEVAILIFFFFFLLTMQYNNDIAWTLKGKKKEIQPPKPRKQRRLKEKIPSTTTERGKQKKSILPAVSLVGCGNRLVKTVICSISSNFTMSILAEGKKESITGKKIFEAMLTINKEADPQKQRLTGLGDSEISSSKMEVKWDRSGCVRVWIKSNKIEPQKKCLLCGKRRGRHLQKLFRSCRREIIFRQRQRERRVQK